MYFNRTGVADEICMANYYLQAIMHCWKYAYHSSKAFALTFEHIQNVVTEMVRI